MSDIENCAKPFLISMIEGNRTTLDKEAQHAIAIWASLRAVIARHTHDPTLPPIHREWLDCLWKDHNVPYTWQVWLARYNGKVPAFYEGHDVRDVELMRRSPEKTELAVADHGILATFVFGNLAIKVFGVRNFTWACPWPDRVIGVSPLATPAVSWPPDRIFVDQEIVEFFGIWIRSVPAIANHK